MPILLIEQGELSPVTDYLLKLEVNVASVTSINGFIQSTSSMVTEL